jgi:hypothetical protein
MHVFKSIPCVALWMPRLNGWMFDLVLYNQLNNESTLTKVDTFGF